MIDIFLDFRCRRKYYWNYDQMKLMRMYVQYMLKLLLLKNIRNIIFPIIEL